MTKYHQLEATERGARKRVGRGISAGQGKTAGRGTKGQKSRTGSKLRPTFMGGQGPLVQRIPKARGFKSLRTPKQVVYLDQLEAVAKKGADNFSLFDAGLVGTPHHGIKIVQRGELKSAVNVKVQSISSGALDAVKKAGGSFEAVPVPLRKSAKQKTVTKK